MNQNRRSRTESEIVEIVGLVHAGMSEAEVCQRFGIHKNQLSTWKLQYPGAQISVAERIRLIEVLVHKMNSRLEFLESCINKKS